MTSEKLNSRLAKLEAQMSPEAVHVYAYGDGSREELDALLDTAPGLSRNAIGSLMWFHWGSPPMRIEWFRGNARRSWAGLHEINLESSCAPS